MNPTTILLLAFAIGVIAGLRALTAPAVVAWAAHRNWLALHSTPLSFLGASLAVVIFTLFAIVELITDQLPSTPARTKPVGFVGAFAGYEVRTRSVKALRAPDFVVAILEDAVAIGGGLWIVTRF